MLSSDNFTQPILSYDEPLEGGASKAERPVVELASGGAKGL
jgi:hypothetical protein